MVFSRRLRLRRRHMVIVLAALCVALCVPLAARAGSAEASRVAGPVPPHVELWTALDHGLDAQRSAMEDWLAAADSAAERFLAGGQLWAGGPFPDFAGEACNRAGGLMAVKPLSQMRRSAADSLPSRDVALLGFHRPQADDPVLVGKLRSMGLLVVGFGSRDAHREAAARCHFWLDAGAPQRVAGAPAASLLSIANLWAFNGEFISACLRRGKMPTVWQSIMMPGSEERNARYRPLRVHADLLPPPLAASSVARANTDSLQHYVRGFRAQEWDRLEEAGRLVRSVREIGRTPHVCPLGGHLRPNLLDLEDTALDLRDVSRYAEPAELRQLLTQGDLLYIQGYTDPPAEMVEAAAASGAFAVLSLGGSEGEAPDRHTADVVLDAQWELGDAAVPLPGYDVPLLPPSGFMAASVYWALVLAAQPDLP